HPVVSNELMVARVTPAPQCAASAYDPAKPISASQPLVESPVCAVRSTCGLAPSAPAATMLPCCPWASTASRYRMWLPSTDAATQGASDDDETACGPPADVHTVSGPTAAAFLFDHANTVSNQTEMAKLSPSATMSCGSPPEIETARSISVWLSE